MRTNLKIIAIALAGFSLAGIGTALADLDDNSVTVGYADGYQGTDGQFHVWEHRSDAEQFRAKHVDKYRPWRHDDPRHQGG